MTDRTQPPVPDDDREVIEATTRQGEPAMAHLAPVMVALVQAGNTVTHRNSHFGFISQPHGWVAYLDEPIDFDLIEARFVLPDTIVLDRDGDRILDNHNWAEVLGGDAQRRLRAQTMPPG